MSHFVMLLICIASFFSICSICQANDNRNPDRNGLPAYTELLDALKNMEPDSTTAAAVSGLVIKRDAAEFVLQDGQLFLCKPIDDRICAAVFEGSGIFSFKPPAGIERLQLKRFYDTDTLNREFSHLHIIFGDTLESELKSQLNFSASSVSKDITKALKYSLKYMVEEKRQSFDDDILKTLLENRINSQFYAHIICRNNDCDDKGPLFYRINPFGDEQITLARRNPKIHDFSREVVCQFNKPAIDTSLKALSAEKRYTFWVDQYFINAEFSDDLKFTARAKLQFTSGTGGQRWIPLNLYYELDVDSVIWGGNQKVDFHRMEESENLWIFSPRILSAGESDSLMVYYHGEVIERLTYWIVLKSLSGWYPHFDIGYDPEYQPKFDMIFRYPSRYQFAAVGQKIAEINENNIICSHWIAPQPIHGASFNIGFFKEYKIEDDRFPTVTILMSEMGHREIEELMLMYGELSGKNMEKQVAGDVANSMALYNQIYGKCPLSNLYAAEISRVGSAYAYQGLIHLPIETFQKTDRMGYDRMLRAHEVAHQWWGIGVDYASYHDKWLSEAFAEYSALLYLQWVLRDNDKFFDRLKEYRDLILDEYDQKYGLDRFAGPVYLGYRSDSSERPGGYSMVIYKKGAWLLHMLRNMLLDLTTLNEDRFMGLMREFYNGFKGKAASTEDFKSLTSRVAGENMDWFFNEWVYGVEIPTYEFSYKVDKTDDGKFGISCRVDQFDVSNDFKMYVPVRIDFGDDRKLRMRYLIEGPHTEFDIPPLPLEPKKVEFNDLESVLCRVKKKKWKDN